jgi:alpha-glucosidase
MKLDYEAHTKRRSYGISVAGWAGQQRFAGTWAGDTGGGEQALVGILQDAVIGHTYATCDMNTQTVEGIHMGFLLPWALINSWASFHYPSFQGDFYDDVYRDYASLRMRLLPYYYSLADEATRSGRAIIRPLFMEYSDVEATYHMTCQHLLGNGFLVTNYNGDRVILPPGRWIDFWSGRSYTGNWEEVTIALPENRGGHLLIRENALIPTGPVEQYVNPSNKEFTWIVSPGNGEGQFTLYLDDGDSLEYRQGHYARATLSMKNSDETVSLEWSEVEGLEKGLMQRTRHRFEFYGMSVRAANTKSAEIGFCRDDERECTITDFISYGEALSVTYEGSVT